MKRKIIIALNIAIILAGLTAWFVFGPLVNQPEGKYFYIRPGDNYEKIKSELLQKKIIPSGFYFELLAIAGNYRNSIRPGRYMIEEGGNMFNLFRKLRSGNQDPVRLVINKLRTRRDLAGKLARNFNLDSAEITGFLSSNDSLMMLNLDTNSLMSAIIPNTYLFFWNTPYKSILGQLRYHSRIFWNNRRNAKLKTLGLDSLQAYTLASIVEEETNRNDEKGIIASVYLNRLSRGMPLQADPTVRFALGDFGIKRILYDHLEVESPYNTYKNTGLPPGPICTPSIATIDSVLNAPKTDYLYFAARADFRGYHSFARTYEEHLGNARKYQKALDSLMASRNNK